MKQQFYRTCRDASSLVLLFLLTAVAQISAAAAPIIVGNGTPESCTEAALRNAMNTAKLYGGGKVKFDCGSSALTITLADYEEIPGFGRAHLIPPNDTTIDGNAVITLAGDQWTLVYVQRGATVSLRNLNLYTNAFAGHIVDNAGTLSLTNGRISGNTLGGIGNSGVMTVKDIVVAFSYSDSAIGNAGILTIKNSKISDNYADNGGIILNGGTLNITESIISNNDADFSSAGGIVNRGSLTIRGSVFADNLAYVNGGIVNYGTLIVSDSIVSGNVSARVSPFSCGAVNNQGVATIRDSKFIDNDSVEGDGGAICNTGTLIASDSMFSGNTSGKYGGGIANRGALTVKDSTISGNVAAIHGGGIYTYVGGTTQLMSTVVTGNIPDNIATAP